jgi:hypothetical protein
MSWPATDEVVVDHVPPPPPPPPVPQAEPVEVSAPEFACKHPSASPESVRPTNVGDAEVRIS